MGLQIIDDCGEWWLRTPGLAANEVRGISEGGKDAALDKVDVLKGVKPAVVFNL